MSQHQQITRPYLPRACKEKKKQQQELTFNQQYIKIIQDFYSLVFNNWLHITPRDIKKYDILCQKGIVFELKRYALLRNPDTTWLNAPFYTIADEISCVYDRDSNLYGICVDIREFGSRSATMAVTVVSLL
jgi:hypothetical protein